MFHFDYSKNSLMNLRLPDKEAISILDMTAPLLTTYLARLCVVLLECKVVPVEHCLSGNSGMLAELIGSLSCSGFLALHGDDQHNGITSIVHNRSGIFIHRKKGPQV